VTPQPTRSRPAAGYAVMLGALALMWGSSYLFIKIGVETLPPLSLVFLRVLVGLVILLVVVAATRTPLPRDPRTLLHLAVLGTVNIAAPFWLIGWAEQHIDSGLAGILQSTAPFFTLILASSFIHDERITRGRLAGIALGFVGIIVLSVENLADIGSALGAERLAAELAVVGASLFYAIGNTYAGERCAAPARSSSRPARSAQPPSSWESWPSSSTGASSCPPCQRRPSRSSGWGRSAPASPTSSSSGC